MPIHPQFFKWESGVMKPLSPGRADSQYTPGETYRLGPIQDTSQKSRGHYHACLNEAFKNLPEELEADVPTVEHLRKFALIKAGFCHTKKVVCDTEEDAQKFAAFLKPIDDYAIVAVNGCVVTHAIAESQSSPKMGKDRFQQSKTKTLDIIAGLTGISTEALKKNAGGAA